MFTLGLHVQVVIQVAIDFLGFPVAFQQTTEDTHAANPKELLGHTGVSSTLPLTKTRVTAFTASFSVLANTSSGVDSHRLLDDQTILDQLTDVLPC